MRKHAKLINVNTPATDKRAFSTPGLLALGETVTGVALARLDETERTVDVHSMKGARRATGETTGGSLISSSCTRHAFGIILPLALPPSILSHSGIWIEHNAYHRASGVTRASGGREIAGQERSRQTAKRIAREGAREIIMISMMIVPLVITRSTSSENLPPSLYTYSIGSLPFREHRHRRASTLHSRVLFNEEPRLCALDEPSERHYSHRLRLPHGTTRKFLTRFTHFIPFLGPLIRR